MLQMKSSLLHDLAVAGFGRMASNTWHKMTRMTKAFRSHHDDDADELGAAAPLCSFWEPEAANFSSAERRVLAALGADVATACVSLEAQMESAIAGASDAHCARAAEGTLRETRCDHVCVCVPLCYVRDTKGAWHTYRRANIARVCAVLSRIWSAGSIV